MQDAITLTEGLKMELVYWLVLGLAGLPFFVKNCIAIWMFFRKPDALTVSRPEFETLKNQFTELRDDSISRHELSGIKEDLSELKQSYKDLDRTLKEISRQLYIFVGSVDILTKTPKL